MLQMNIFINKQEIQQSESESQMQSFYLVFNFTFSL